MKLKYYWAKAVTKLQPSARRDCVIDKTAKTGYKSNLIRVKMGKYSYLGNNNSICDTEIGNFCSIASFCAIGGGEHPISAVSTSPLFCEGKNIFGKNFAALPTPPSETVRIGNDVWIGENCFIKSGITIGDGAIIGAHSVVTKDVPPFAIVAGCPAKFIRYRFDEETIRELMQIAWWSLPDDEIRKIAPLFSSPDNLIHFFKKGRN